MGATPVLIGPLGPSEEPATVCDLTREPERYSHITYTMRRTKPRGLKPGTIRTDIETNHIIALRTMPRFGCTELYWDEMQDNARIKTAIDIDGVYFPAGHVVDEAFIQAVLMALRCFGFTMVSLSVVKGTIETIARRDKQNPVKDYLLSLQWDGTPRLDRWLVSYCGARDEPFVRAAGARFLIAAVGRAIEPGLKFDSVLILHGRKGGGKSTALRVLGGEYFTEVTNLPLQGTRNNHPMQGKWLGEFPEMDRLVQSDRDAAAFKAWIAMTSDRILPPYAAAWRDVPRTWVLAGTTNEKAWIKDADGERRFWVVTVADTLDLEGLQRDRAQLLAEAVSRFRQPDREPLFMDTPELQAGMREALGDFAEENPLERGTWQWLSTETLVALRQGGDIQSRPFSPDDLACDGYRPENPKHRAQVKKALERAGLIARRPTVNGVKASAALFFWPSQEAAQAFVTQWENADVQPGGEDDF